MSGAAAVYYSMDGFVENIDFEIGLKKCGSNGC